MKFKCKVMGCKPFPEPEYSTAGYGKVKFVKKCSICGRKIADGILEDLALWKKVRRNYAIFERQISLDPTLDYTLYSVTTEQEKGNNTYQVITVDKNNKENVITEFSGHIQPGVFQNPVILPKGEFKKIILRGKGTAPDTLPILATHKLLQGTPKDHQEKIDQKPIY